MQSKILSRPTRLTVVLAIFLSALGLIYYFIFKSPTENNSQMIGINNALLANPTLPMRIKIPNINIDTAVEYVGLTPDGRVGVPSGAVNVAWFNLSPLPGETGSAVIDGHSGYKDDRPAVFDNLYKLNKGDKIYIEDERGATTTFVVRESKSYGKNEDVAEVFNSSDTEAHLNLITCDGDWNAVEKTHSDRLVVFADKINS